MTKVPPPAWPPVRSYEAPPDLSGGHCVTGRAGLPASAWDEDAGPGTQGLAIAACSRCPVREPCGDWVMSLPSRNGSRPRGVTAGVLRRSPVPRPGAASATAAAGLATAAAAPAATRAPAGALAGGVTVYARAC